MSKYFEFLGRIVDAEVDPDWRELSVTFELSQWIAKREFATRLVWGIDLKRPDWKGRKALYDMATCLNAISFAPGEVSMICKRLVDKNAIVGRGD